MATPRAAPVSPATSRPPISIVPAVGSFEPGDHAQHGRLAAAEKAQEDGEVAVFDGEGDVRHGRGGVEALGHGANVYAMHGLAPSARQALIPTADSNVA